VLAAGLVALGTWMLVDRYTGPEYDATTLIDDWYAASNASDAQAISTLLTPDAVLWVDGTTFSGPKAIANQVTSTPGLRVERTAPVTVEGDFASTFMAMTNTTIGVSNAPLSEVYQLKDGKIFRLWAFALGVTAPFDNTSIPS
jgi:hypothetical protein